MKPKEIAAKLAEILSEITVANGFNTDAGMRVYRGKLKLDEDKVPCIIIGEADDVVRDENCYGRSISVDQNFVIDAYVRCDPDNPNDAAHDVIEDLKKAVFKPVPGKLQGGAFAPFVKRLSYVNRHIGPRPDGNSFVLGSITIKLSYSEEFDK